MEELHAILIRKRATLGNIGTSIHGYTFLDVLVSMQAGMTPSEIELETGLEPHFLLDLKKALHDDGFQFPATRPRDEAAVREARAEISETRRLLREEDPQASRLRAASEARRARIQRRMV
jgi:hypothetical protein